jgi:hypothetical protein
MWRTVGHHLSDCLQLRQVRQQALCRRLALGEGPDPQKKGMKGAKRPFGPAGDLARLPKGDSSISCEPTKRVMGDSVLASDEASYVTGSIPLVDGQFKPWPAPQKLALDFLLRRATMTSRQLPVTNFI